MPQPKLEPPPQYDPHDVEAPLYRRWQERGVFRPRPDGEPYVIVIPPPNVTAILHVGHGLNNIIQDVRSEEHTSELQSRSDLVCRLLLEKKKELPLPLLSSGNHQAGTRPVSRQTEA